PAAGWACGVVPPLPARIRIGSAVVALGPDAALYPHHLNPLRAYDMSMPAATIARHPTNPSRLGLRNETAGAWVATLPDGVTREVPAGRSVALSNGLRVQFGSVEGEVRVEG